MIKKLFLGLGIIVLLLIVGVVLAFSYIDSLAKTAIERGSTYALGVNTTVSSVDVGVLGGTFDMGGLKVANPEGYQSAHFLALGDGGVAVSLGTLRQDVVNLPYLTLSDISVNLEKREGKANYKVILDNLKRFESDQPADPKEPKPAKEGKKFIVEKIEISNVNVHVDLLPMGGDVTKLDVPIEKIELTGVGTGSNQNGVAMGELTDIVIKAILDAVVEKAGNVLPAGLVNDLQSQLADLKSLSEMGVNIRSQINEESLKKVEEALKGAGGAVDDLKKQAEESADKLKEEAEKAKDSLKDLIPGGGNKDK